MSAWMTALRETERREDLLAEAIRQHDRADEAEWMLHVERCHKENRGLVPWLIAALFLGWAVFATQIAIDLMEQRDACVAQTALDRADGREP